MILRRSFASSQRNESEHMHSHLNTREVREKWILSYVKRPWVAYEGIISQSQSTVLSFGILGLEFRKRSSLCVRGIRRSLGGWRREEGLLQAVFHVFALSFLVPQVSPQPYFTPAAIQFLFSTTLKSQPHAAPLEPSAPGGSTQRSEFCRF